MVGRQGRIGLAAIGAEQDVAVVRIRRDPADLAQHARDRAGPHEARQRAEPLVLKLALAAAASCVMVAGSTSG